MCCYIKNPKLYSVFYLLPSAFCLLVSSIAHAQVSADYWNGGAVRIGASTTTCDAAAEGAIRYNDTSNTMEFCNGVSWTALVQTQSTPAPTAPAGSGYFVLTGTTWDGNLGGLAGADAKCLSELSTTHTTWVGYTDANGRGLLTGANVKAFMYAGGSGNNLMPLTTYYFARADSATAGGAYFTTDSSGRGPQDSNNWSAANYFSGSFSYWTARNLVSGNLWENNMSDPWTHCGAFGSNSSGSFAGSGASSHSNSARWFETNTTCNIPLRLICFINP